MTTEEAFFYYFLFCYLMVSLSNFVVLLQMLGYSNLVHNLQKIWSWTVLCVHVARGECCGDVTTLR